MDISLDDLEVTNSPDASRFETWIGDKVAFVTYKIRGSTIAYLHTEVPTSLEGHGIAGKLAKHALEFARANGLDVVLSCPHISDYINRHPEYQDLVLPPIRWREFLNAR
jgi:hypothetical protein